MWTGGCLVGEPQCLLAADDVVLCDLGRFAVESEAAEMRVSSSVVQLEMGVMLPLCLRRKSLSDGRMEWETDGRIVASALVIRVLLWSLVVKK